MLGWASDYRQKLRAAIGPHEPSDLRSEFGEFDRLIQVGRREPV